MLELGPIKEKSEIIGNHIKCKVVKNKVAPPFKVAEFDILYGKGISREGEIVDVGVNLDIISKSGSWFSYDGERIGQGKENAKKFLEENPDIFAEIERKIKQQSEQIALAEEIEDDDDGDEELLSAGLLDDDDDDDAPYSIRVTDIDGD